MQWEICIKKFSDLLDIAADGALGAVVTNHYHDQKKTDGQCHSRGSNPGTLGFEFDALPTELPEHYTASY